MSSGGEEQIQLQMTPMVDIVFLLLVFFLMTFKIVAPEGDFNVKMPLAAPTQGRPDDALLPPIQVRLRATDDGRLAGIQMGERPLNSFGELRREIRAIVGDDRGPGSIAEDAEVKLDCDYQLEFKYTIDAITAISGYISPDGRIIRLVDKISFAQPRTPADK
jgi:biopolymer transport protein ExbD